MDLDAKKHVLRQLACGVHLLGVRDERAEGVGHLTTVSWVSQLSVEPPLVGVALEVASRSLARVRSSGSFTLSLVGPDGRNVASKLGRSSADVPYKDAGVATTASPNVGAPVPQVATGWVECRLRSELAVGDHVLVVGEVIAAGVARDEAPLTLRETGWIYGG